MRRTFIFIGCLVVASKLSAQITDEHLYQGNKAYAKGQFQAAAKSYEKSLREKKSREAQYNLGNALYQQRKYDQAGKQYQEAAKLSSQKSLQSFAHHNAGNSFLEQKKWDDAIASYKQSLRINPNSEDTRYNLAYAQKMKEQEEKQQKSDKNKDQQKEQQDQQQNNNQQNKQQNQDQKQQSQPQKPDQKPGQESETKPEPQASKLSREQAEQILNALNQEEKKLRERKDKASGKTIKLDKDW